MALSREDVAKHIAASGDSPFTSPPFTQSVVRKTSNFSQGGNMISCEGSQFPKTKESPANIEVLKAWRTITSHPQFKVGVQSFGRISFVVSSFLGRRCQPPMYGVHEEGAM
jgi:hypothetical protein